MKHIWCGLEKKLKDKRIEPIKDATLVSIKPKGELVTLGFKFSDKEKLSYYTAKSVILAIPKAPLEKIVLGNRGVFSESICKEIDGVFGFSLVKIFVVVKKRWWEEDQRANVGATSIPTRELHYWKSLTPGSARGMIMIYTDRPGSIFWTNYVGTRGRQEGPFTNRDQDIGDVFKSTQMKRLKAKVVEVLKEAGAGNLKVSDVEYCGIMDWGREPYGGASHAWRPERRPSDVLTSLSSFNLGLEPQNAEGKGTIHICGEAYSDYQGFIEGALRSAAHVLHRIDPAHRLVVDTTVCAEDRREIKTLTPRFCPCCTAAPARPQSAS
ncbi:MAG TPA: FAD-dependent oxidoreductase [Pseudolabrys sp.]|nr:FAD-dependent oxidoreductase [Pseudolabrys sp.]